VSINLALQAALFLAPFAGHLVVEVAADLSVELIDVHGADAIAEASVLGPEPLDRRLVLPALVSMAGVERLANPGQHLVVKAQPAKQLSELSLQRFLAHMLAPARCRIALAFIRVAGAVVVNVTLLLDLADHRASASGTGDQPREGEVVRHAAALLGEAAAHYALHPLPQFYRDQRLVPTYSSATAKPCADA